MNHHTTDNLLEIQPNSNFCNMCVPFQCNQATMYSVTKSKIEERVEGGYLDLVQSGVLVWKPCVILGNFGKTHC